MQPYGITELYSPDVSLVSYMVIIAPVHILSLLRFIKFYGLFFEKILTQVVFIDDFNGSSKTNYRVYKYHFYMSSDKANYP